jgi:hypothetical protein
MNGLLIFSYKKLNDSNFNFASLLNLKKEFQKKNIKFTPERELMAEVIKFNNAPEELIDIVKHKLPDNFNIIVILEGRVAILSNRQLKFCFQDDPEMIILLKEAHLELSSEADDLIIGAKNNVNLDEIDKLCDEFADEIGFVVPFNELNVDQLYYRINIVEEYEHKLFGMLIDIKTIWFAMEYDLLQLAKNMGTDSVSKFKRYMYINNSILRIRALWEKLIGFAVLLESPEEFEKTFSARRVRSTFLTKFEAAKNPVTQKIWNVLHTVELFDQRFRTPEVHKIGRTIHWATQESLGNEVNRLMGHRNDLNSLLREIVEDLMKK